jgi:hypothetical protein
LRSALALLLFLCQLFALPSNSGKIRPWGYFEKDSWKLAHAINLEVGSHVNGFGYGISAMRLQEIAWSKKPIGIFYLTGHAEVKHYESCLGMPGRSQAAKGFLMAMWGWGRHNSFPSRYYHLSPSTAHNIGFYYAGYLSNDNTSQVSGGWQYSYVGNNSKIRMRYENDWYGFRFTDEFRTSAVQVDYFRLVSSHILGAGTGFILWTGRTEDSFGTAYSHGILYLSMSYGGIGLQFGMDSEKIRDFIQNKYHQITGVRTIPLVERSDRFYFQLSVFNMGSLY